ncbi:hypothetical protein [Reinekea sp.]|jgi:hypothetical protein|uniref:hypothetical protein n=1 Tax=Reinekea sp. TaxID=1970455 RepID=UPI002A83F57E|nr:hypothetical protein [Reinekea sp.]
MWSVLKFSLFANLAAAGLLALLYLGVPQIHQAEPIDLLFFTGLLFWLGSTLVRLSNRRFKKGLRADDIGLTDPQQVLQANSLALKLLLAGVPALLVAVLGALLFY